MDYYHLAKGMGKVAFSGVWLAAAYYLARTAFIFAMKRPSLAGFKGVLEQVVPIARNAHPYIGVAVLLVFPFHAFMMYSPYGIGVRMVTGMVSAAGAVATISLGFALWRNRGNLKVRQWHRLSMFMLLAAATAHNLFK
ncbi:MAG: hypothetical protein P4N41_24665 [Negativicutes bacterium]|nr:hypothetical protein [Negativicutes bacterium]MDR3592864.1 hypothetical protein [Negativicutes bacterium]